MYIIDVQSAVFQLYSLQEQAYEQKICTGIGRNLDCPDKKGQNG